MQDMIERSRRCHWNSWLKEWFRCGLRAFQSGHFNREAGNMMNGKPNACSVICVSGVGWLLAVVGRECPLSSYVEAM